MASTDRKSVLRLLKKVLRYDEIVDVLFGRELFSRLARYANPFGLPDIPVGSRYEPTSYFNSLLRTKKL